MSFRSLQGLLFSVCLAAPLGADIVIDDFSVAQGPLSLSSTGSVTDHNADSASIFLGERNLRVGGANFSGGAVSIQVTGGNLNFNRPGTSEAEMAVWWDGDNDSGSFDPNSGTPFDLTAGGTLDAVRLAVVSSSSASVVLRLDVWTDGSNFSTAVFTLPAAGGTIDVPYSTFTRTANAGASFDSVRAIFLATYQNSSGALSSSISSISATAVSASETLVGENFRVSQAGTDGDGASLAYPAIAYNGSGEALVVWGQFAKLAPGDSGEQHEIFGQRIDTTTGEPIGSAIRISDMGGDTPGFTYATNNPDVVYNATADEYLVVWRGDDNIAPLVDEDFEIFGQRINAATGAPVGNNDFRISFMGGTGDTASFVDNPAVAWDSVNNLYLVVWSADDSAIQDDKREIWGRLLQADGTSLSSDDIRLSTTFNTTDVLRGAAEPDVAFDPVNFRYLVVWYGDHHADNAIDIYGQFVTTGGAESGSDFRVSDLGDSDADATYSAFAPRVIFNSEAREFLVVFHGDDNTPGDDLTEIFGQRITASSGAQVGTNDFRISDFGPPASNLQGAYYPDVVYDPASNSYLIVWHGDAVIDNDTEVWGQRINVSGALTGDGPFRISDMGQLGSNMFIALNPAVIWTGSNAVVVWRGDDQIEGNTETEVFGQLIEIETPPIEMHGDFDGDGRDDLLLRDSAGNVGVWFMNGGAIDSGASIGSAGGYSIAGIGDFNGDGRDDILLRDDLGNIGLWIMNGSSITGGGAVGSPGGYSIAAVADFDGDGRDDILLRDDLGNIGLWIMNGSAIASGHLVGSPGAYQVAGTGDFDGDGKADILLRDTLGNLGMWLMNGAVISAGGLVGSPGAYEVAGVADFNGDDRADILLSDTLGNLGMWLMNGTYISGGSLVGSPAGYRANSVGDYNGDLRSDIVLRHDATGDVGMWLMNGATIVSGHLVASPGTSYTIY